MSNQGKGGSDCSHSPNSARDPNKELLKEATGLLMTKVVFSSAGSTSTFSGPPGWSPCPASTWSALAPWRSADRRPKYKKQRLIMQRFRTCPRRQKPPRKRHELRSYVPCAVLRRTLCKESSRTSPMPMGTAVTTHSTRPTPTHCRVPASRAPVPIREARAPLPEGPPSHYLPETNYIKSKKRTITLALAA